MSTKNVMAIDLGASNGRVIIAQYDGEKIKLEEVHRFANGYVNLGENSYWDFLYLFDNIKKGLSSFNGKLDSLAVDTWGVDFGFLDKNGELLSNPRSYRDSAFSVANMEQALCTMGGGAALYKKNRHCKFTV